HAYVAGLLAAMSAVFVRNDQAQGCTPMTPTLAGVVLIVGLLLLLGSGMPIAFALGLAAITGLFFDMGPDVIYVIAETMFAGIANLAYVAIPMFVLMGAIVAGTP